jgi:hypothetical protein
MFNLVFFFLAAPPPPSLLQFLASVLRELNAPMPHRVKASLSRDSAAIYHHASKISLPFFYSFVLHMYKYIRIHAYV